MSRPIKVVKPYFDPQTSPLGPQKDKNDLEIKSNSNVRIQENHREWKLFNYKRDRKTVVELHSEPKNSPLKPKK